MTIAAILTSKGSEVATIAGDESLSSAVAELGGRRIGALLVVDGGEVTGIISERDIIYCLRGAQILDWAVSRAMSAPVTHVAPETEVLSAMALMTQQRIRHLPVIEQGQLKGIVSIGDLVKYRIDRIEREAEAMRAYIQSA
jgi:CBS domain-containing protein